MPARRKPKSTSKYLLDRMDYQFYAASLALKRLRIAFGPDSNEFKIDIQKEINDLEYRVRRLTQWLKQLAASIK